MWLQPPSFALASITYRLGWTHPISAVLLVHLDNDVIGGPPSSMVRPISGTAFTLRGNLAPPVRLVCMITATDGAVRGRLGVLEGRLDRGLDRGLGRYIRIVILLGQAALDGSKLCFRFG